MRWLPNGVWRYATVLMLLLVLAAGAAQATIESIQSYLVGKIGNSSFDLSQDLFRVITIPILSLTMGFLFLAGALGIWAIRTNSVLEGRRRVGRLVDAMDYLRDGLVAIDHKGFVTGSNPAARAFSTEQALTGRKLRDAFPCLDAENEGLLLDKSGAHEVECIGRAEAGVRALRFRSQPSEDMTLIIISDVTGKRAAEMRGRQSARLQLIGRIARGVAHDFNSILSAVSGYAGLLERSGKSQEGRDEALKAIIKESRRGAVLANQMLELSRSGANRNPCCRLAEHVGKAAELLRVGLSADWQVITDIRGDFPPISLSDTQIEQIVANIGLLAADELARPGFIHIRVRPPVNEPMLDVGDEYCAVALISAYGPEPHSSDEQVFKDEAAGDAGAIQSVVRSMVEEVGGRFDLLVGNTGKGERHSFRFCLPRHDVSDERMSALAGIPEEIRAYISNWHVLLAGGDGYDEVVKRFKDAGMNVSVARDIVTALQHVEADRDLQGMIIARELLGEQADALLRAIIKLRPAAGLVVLASSPDSSPEELKKDIIFEPLDVSPENALQSLVRAKELAGGRKRG